MAESTMFHLGFLVCCVFASRARSQTKLRNVCDGDEGCLLQMGLLQTTLRLMGTNDGPTVSSQILTDASLRSDERRSTSMKIALNSNALLPTKNFARTTARDHLVEGNHKVITKETGGQCLGQKYFPVLSEKLPGTTADYVPISPLTLYMSSILVQYLMCWSFSKLLNKYKGDRSHEQMQITILRLVGFVTQTILVLIAVGMVCCRFFWTDLPRVQSWGCLIFLVYSSYYMVELIYRPVGFVTRMIIVHHVMVNVFCLVYVQYTSLTRLNCFHGGTYGVSAIFTYAFRVARDLCPDSDERKDQLRLFQKVTVVVYAVMTITALVFQIAILEESYCVSLGMFSFLFPVFIAWDVQDWYGFLNLIKEDEHLQ